MKKLIDAMKSRLIEIECLDNMILNNNNLDSDQTHFFYSISDQYSSLYAFAHKVLSNNEDPNNLMIVQKLIENFLLKSEE